MRLLDPWRQASEVADLRLELTMVAGRIDAIKAALVGQLSSEVAALGARIDRESLSWAELYDKTHHYLKRIEQRQRTEGPIPEETANAGVDQVTARIQARRNRRG